MSKQRPYISLRPTFADVVDRHPVDLSQLAQQAQVGDIVVSAMLAERPVCQFQAEKILEALTRQTGVTYTLETVRIRLYSGVRYGR